MRPRLASRRSQIDSAAGGSAGQATTPGAAGAAERRPPAWPLLPVAVAALGAGAYLLAAPPSADLAAQEYRAELGLGLWNNGWFAGHHTPGYSVLFPPLAGALGVRVTGAIAVVVAAALFAALARRHWGPRAGAAAALWFAVAATPLLLLTGRMTFALGVAVGLGALLALQRGRVATASALAATTTLASPVAGLFVALAAAAWGLAALGDGARGATARPAGARRPGEARSLATALTSPAGSRLAQAAAIAAAALAPVAVTLVLFPQGGSEPFVASAFWPALAATALLAVLLPAGERTLRAGAALYALLLVAAFALATPLGGNATRLGALAAGPIAVGALAGRRPAALVAALVVAFAYWALYPAVRDVARAAGDPSTEAAYHAGLVRFLQSRPGDFRVEIPLTANHWEARHVAPAVPLARGWERQLDRRDGALFYDGRLDAARYRAWLDARAVAYVAVPDVALDDAGRDEARLIAGGLPYLREAWRDRHWRVYAVDRPAPLGDGARVTLGARSITLRAARAGDVLVRVHHTRWWRVVAGRGCVRAGPGGMTVVRVAAPGVVRLRARLQGSACRR